MEIWKSIEGYEGLYEVSDLGNIKSLERLCKSRGKRFRPTKEMIKKQVPNKQGYMLISLSKNSKCKNFSVHRLVAKAFIPNPNNFPQVNHKDEIKSNNAVENLEWCDGKYNSNYGTARIRQIEPRLIPIIQLDKNNNVIKEWKSCSETKKFGFEPRHVNACCKKIQKTHIGYKWEYKNLKNE